MPLRFVIKVWRAYYSGGSQNIIVLRHSNTVGNVRIISISGEACRGAVSSTSMGYSTHVRQLRSGIIQDTIFMRHETRRYQRTDRAQVYTYKKNTQIQSVRTKSN